MSKVTLGLHGHCPVCHSFPMKCCFAGETEKKSTQSQQLLCTLPCSNGAVSVNTVSFSF